MKYPAYVIGTLHPAALLRSQKMQICVLRDLKKLVRIQKEGPTLIPKCERLGTGYPRASLYPTLEDVATFFGFMTGQRMSVDFEATFAGEIWCMGLWPVDTWLDEQGLCIPFRCRGGSRYWSTEEERQVLGLVKEFLEDPTSRKVGQNWVGFDGGYSDDGWDETHYALTRRAWGVRPRGLDIDTMVAHHCVWPELPHSLAHQASMDTDLPAYKEEVHQTEGTEEEADDLVKFENLQEMADERLHIYCLRDCFAQAGAALSLERLMA